MKKLVALFLGVAALFATPAMASDFTGARVEVSAGVDDVTNGFDTTDVVYGATVGYDVGLTENVIAGLEANVDNVFDRRDIGVSARLGVALNDNVLVYGKAGYTNYKDVFSRELDGLRVGGGLEVNLSKNLFTGVEYRYTDFEAGVGKHAGLAKIGLRF